MSYFGKGWTSVEDLEKSLVSASKITQSSEPACVPKDQFSTFSRKQNVIRGRGQMIIEQEKNSNVGLRDQRIAQDLRTFIPGFRGFSNIAIPEIISSCGQFDSASDDDLEEPYFSGKKVTSTPSTSGNKSDVCQSLTPSSPTVSGGLGIAEPHQDSVVMNGLNNTGTKLDQTNASESLPDISVGNLEVSTDLPETSLGQSDTSYKDPFYYSFDDSVYVKTDIPIVPVTDAPTPSPCSSPLPHHLTIDEQYVSCVQVETDSSPSPSLIFDSDIPDAACFNGIALNGSAGRVLTGTDEPSCEDLPEDSTCEVHVPNDTAGKVADKHLSSVSEQSPNQLQNVINTAPHKTRPEIFEDYLKFCKQVRNSFPSQPEVYDGFLALMDNRKEKVDEKSLVESASSFFRFHPELVESFKKLTSANFSLSLFEAAGARVAKIAPKKVGSLSGSTRPRRCRNALILNLLKKEAIKEDSALTDQVEVKPVRLDSNMLHTECDLDKRIEVPCDENGNNDVEESVSTHSLDVSTHSAVGYITANPEFGDVSLPVLDSTNISDVLCSVDDCDGIQDPMVPLCDFVAGKSNMEGVLELDGVEPLPNATNRPIDAGSLPTAEPLQDKPVELLKPEDIIPKIQNHISSLEIAHEIASSAVDPIMIQGVVDELIEVEHDESCPKSDIELLKPSDFVHLESISVDEAVNALEESNVDLGVTALDPVEDLMVEENAVKASSKAVVLYSGEKCISIGADHVDAKPLSAVEELNEALVGNGDGPKDELELLKPSDFVHSERNSVLVDESDGIPLEPVVSLAAAASDSVQNSTVEKYEGVLFTKLCAGGESKSDEAVLSSAGVMDSINPVVIDTSQPSDATYDSDGHQVEIGHPIPSLRVEVGPADEIEQKLNSVVVALAKMDLNTDFTDTESENSRGVPPSAISLPATADDSLEGQEILDESSEAEFTMTVHAIPSVPQTSSHLDANGAADTPQQNDGPLLLRHDQFTNLSTAVDPSQDQQDLQKDSKDLNSLD